MTQLVLGIPLLQSNALSEFGGILLFILGGIMFVLLGLTVNRFLAPRKPNEEKNSTYESGEVPVGDAMIQLNTRFYLVGLIFLIFDVEVLFLYPWATVYADRSIIQALPEWGIWVMVEMGLFAGILLLGLIYAWIKGDLEWIKPQPIMDADASSSTLHRYQVVNQKYQGKRAPKPQSSAKL